MKAGKSLSALAQEIERQAAAKADYIVPATGLSMIPSAGDQDPLIEFRNGDRKVFSINEHAHRQIGEKMGIPAKYYDRMLTGSAEDKLLLMNNVNHWLHASDKLHMVRTLDGRARAFMSNAYQRIDNIHIAETVLPILGSQPSMEVVSCEVTERKLYIKAVDHSIQAPVRGSRRVGDVVEAGIVISNSEVGLGAASVSPFFHFLACLNGMIRNKEGLRAAHIGSKLADDEGLARLLADDTRKHLDQGILLKVRDVVRAAMSFDRFMESIKQMEADADPITALRGNPVAAIELLGDDLHMQQSERSSVLRHLIAGGDLSKFGVMNAVTRTAEDLESYDRATEFEAMGGQVLDMAPAAWKRIAEAE